MKKADKNFIKNLKEVAIGYKMFGHNWEAKHGNGGYEGLKVGDVFMVEGDIQECNWGIHFSKNPLWCFNFYEAVQWNKFAKIKAYDQILDCENKSVTNVMEIIELLSWNEFIEEIKKINGSKGINWSKGINGSKYIDECLGLYKSIFCYNISGKFLIFNKQTTEKRIDEVLSLFSWVPSFNNSFDLKGKKEWFKTNIPEITTTTPKQAYLKIPKDVEDKIKELPEFDQEIWDKIIHRFDKE